MSRRGVPNFNATPAQREAVKLYAAAGIPHEHIAMLITNGDGGPSISVDTLTRHFADELAMGLSSAIGRVTATLFSFISGSVQGAMPSDRLRATMFFLNTRGKWATNANVDAPEPDAQDEVAIAAQIAGLLERAQRRAKEAAGKDGGSLH